MNAVLLAVLLLWPGEPQYSPRGVALTGRVITKQGTFQPGFAQFIALSRESLLGPGTDPLPEENALEVPVKKDGTFEFSAIRPGTYTLRILPVMPGVAPYSVEVGRQNVRDIRLVVPYQIEVSGRVENLGPAYGVHPIIQSDQGTFTMSTIVLDDGTFKLRLSDGENRISISRLPPNLVVKSIMFGDVDVTKSPLNIDKATLSRPLVVTLEVAPAESLPAVSARANVEP